MLNPLSVPQTSSIKGKGKALPSGPPALTPTIDPAPPWLPLICWEGTPAFSAHTTKLIEWCKKNESARIKLFSDSTQDAKEAGQKKEVSGVSKEDYFQQLAKQIFVNDSNQSQSHPHLFTTRINCCIQDLCKKYNKVNHKLGQTGAGLVADIGQNVATKALWGEEEVEGEANEDGKDDAEDNMEGVGDVGEILSGNTSLYEKPANESHPGPLGLNSFNRHDGMDIDQDDLHHPTPLQQPPPQVLAPHRSPTPVSFHGSCHIPKLS
ncbi:hypothetical protein BS17DRAFT_814988 [Gyrodon lividus]|nr:hypothetical protein BS17DRAFT_814988 [Gyrodon lividus]